MVKIQVGKQSIYYDGVLVSNLKIAKKYVKKDFDMLIVVYGIEGGAKSTLAQQIGAYLDPTLSLDRIVFNAEEFRDAVIKAKPEECIIFDEAHGSLSSRGAMSKINRMLVSLLAEIRQKRLYVLIVLPSLWELDRYVAVWRSRCAIEVYTKGFTRGFFKFYSSEKKKSLYMKGKKFYENYVPPDFYGRFCKGFYVDDSAYRAKKTKSMMESFEKKDPDNIFKKQRDVLISYLVNNKFPHREIGEIIGLSRVAITRITGDVKKQGDGV